MKAREREKEREREMDGSCKCQCMKWSNTGEWIKNESIGQTRRMWSNSTSMGQKMKEGENER